MKKKIKGKLKLNKLTVSNLSNVKGGKVVYCPCDGQITNGAYNHDNPSRWVSICMFTCFTCLGQEQCG
ncbi:MAG: hypothetical protein GY950_01160 [bacterium]|nr:hypothetical protein [bacterium]